MPIVIRNIDDDYIQEQQAKEDYKRLTTREREELNRKLNQDSESNNQIKLTKRVSSR